MAKHVRSVFFGQTTLGTFASQFCGSSCVAVWRGGAENFGFRKAGSGEVQRALDLKDTAANSALGARCRHLSLYVCMIRFHRVPVVTLASVVRRDVSFANWRSWAVACRFDVPSMQAVYPVLVCGQCGRY